MREVVRVLQRLREGRREEAREEVMVGSMVVRERKSQGADKAAVP